MGKPGKTLSGPSVSNELRSGEGPSVSQTERLQQTPPNTILLDTKMFPVFAVELSAN